MILLSGCGGGDGGAIGSGGVTVVGGGAAATPPAGPVATTGPISADAALLNLALNLEYLGAQFLAYASSGAGQPAALTTGLGQQGAATGGRRIAFADPLIGRYAAELAADKQAQVTALRGQLGASAAAQPAIDLSAGPSSAFSSVAQAAAIVPPGAGFDPFANDGNFLFAAFLLQNAVAANYRSILTSVTADDAVELSTANLAAAVYHGGLIRSMLTAWADSNARATGWTTATGAYFARLDGSDRADQALATMTGKSANLVDADGSPIPFMRGTTQVLTAVYLSAAASPGGFFPSGINGASQTG